MRKTEMKPSSTDFFYRDKLRLFKADPEQFFRENPRPRFGFRPSEESDVDNQK